jgi:hypothetical protein
MIESAKKKFKVTHKGVLVTFMLLLSFALGACYYFLIIGMLLSFPGFGGGNRGGWIIFFDQAEFTKLFILFVSLTVIFGVVLHLVRKVMKNYIMGCVLIMIVSMILTPFVSHQLSSDLISVPSSKAQNKATQDIKNMILDFNLPYEMDQIESERLTRMNKRITNVVLRTIKGEIVKKEIDTFIQYAKFNECYSNFYLFLYSQDKSESIVLIINENSIVSYCSPLEKCEKFNLEI